MPIKGIKCKFCATIGNFNCTKPQQANACISRKQAAVSIQKWVTNSGLTVSTYTLDHDDPMHPYNQLLAQKVVPEHHGVSHPLEEEFKEISRGKLINEIMRLRKEIKNAHTS